MAKEIKKYQAEVTALQEIEGKLVDNQLKSLLVDDNIDDQVSTCLLRYSNRTLINEVVKQL